LVHPSPKACEERLFLWYECMYMVPYITTYVHHGGGCVFRWTKKMSIPRREYIPYSSILTIARFSEDRCVRELLSLIYEEEIEQYGMIMDSVVGTNDGTITSRLLLSYVVMRTIMPNARWEMRMDNHTCRLIGTHDTRDDIVVCVDITSNNIVHHHSPYTPPIYTSSELYEILEKSRGVITPNTRRVYDHVFSIHPIGRPGVSTYYKYPGDIDIFLCL